MTCIHNSLLQKRELNHRGSSSRSLPMLPSVAVGVVAALCANEEMAASAVVMVLAVEVDAATATRCCQVCGKTGHTTLRCYKYFDANYNGDDKHANVATSSYNIDTDWHTNTGATDHITSEID
jgi:hypothetical protein